MSRTKQLLEEIEQDTDTCYYCGIEFVPDYHNDHNGEWCCDDCLHIYEEEN